MVLTATLTAGMTPIAVDGYIVLRLPDGRLVSLRADGPVVGVEPFARGFVPVAVSGEIVRYTFTGGELPGVYTWFAALAQAGTANEVGAIDQDDFAVSR